MPQLEEWQMGLGLAAAIIGLVTALLSRKRIVVHRTEVVEPGRPARVERRPRVTPGKRFGVFLLGSILGFLCFSFFVDHYSESQRLIGDPRSIAGTVAALFGCVFIALAFYNLLAFIFLLFRGMFRGGWE